MNTQQIFRVLRFCGVLFVFAGVFLASPRADAVEAPITRAQPKLQTVPLIITGQDKKPHKFTVELARTHREQEIGEMFRTHIPEDSGMLFVLPQVQESAMWMRNTLVSLDVVFIDETNSIHAIEERTIPLSEGIISSYGAVRAVLELPAGTAERLGVVVGDHVSSPALPLGPS